MHTDLTNKHINMITIIHAPFNADLTRWTSARRLIRLWKVNLDGFFLTFLLSDARLSAADAVWKLRRTSSSTYKYTKHGIFLYALPNE